MVSFEDEERADIGNDSDSSLVQEFSAEWDRIKRSNYGQTVAVAAAATPGSSSSGSSSLLQADSGFESGSPVGHGQGAKPLQTSSSGSDLYENLARDKEASGRHRLL